MVRKAEELAQKHGWFLARQFENQANPAYHRSTTGPEILQDFVGKRLDYFVTGWGTGGTLTGAGEMIKLARPDVQDHRDRAAEAAQLLGGKPFAPHKIQGWTPDFVPGVLDRERARPRSSRSTDAEAIERARAWRRAKAFSAASPAARPSPRRSRWRAKRADGLRDPRDAAGHRRALSIDVRCSKASTTAAIPSRERHRRANSRMRCARQPHPGSRR